MHLLAGNHIHLQHTNLVRIVFHTRIEELHLVARTDRTVQNLKVGNNTTEGIEYRVEDKCLQGSLLITFGMRNALNDSIQDILNALASLTAGTDDVLRITTN